MTENRGKYMYCVIQAEEPQTFESLGIGGRSDPLTTVHWKDLACVVSDSPLGDYPVMRDYTMAHYGAIEAVRKRFPALLPVAFNTIAKEGEQAVIEKVLKPRREEFLGLLDWVVDKEEVGVKVYWRSMDMEPVYKKILEENPSIRSLRDELAARPAVARYYDQIELGKQVQAAMKAKQEAEQKRIVETLKAYAEDVRCNTVYGDRWLLNAAFLVKKVKTPKFIEAVQALGESPDGDLLFRVTDGGAPFNFVEVRITWKEEAHVSYR